MLSEHTKESWLEESSVAETSLVDPSNGDTSLSEKYVLFAPIRLWTPFLLPVALVYPGRYVLQELISYY